MSRAGAPSAPPSAPPRPASPDALAAALDRIGALLGHRLRCTEADRAAHAGSESHVTAGLPDAVAW
ncbi:MAG: hypothetical protein ACK4OP_13100, partial [Gemmobacter sp.]